MKKLFLKILVFSFFFGGSTYAKITFIKCTEDKFTSNKLNFVFEINDRRKDIKLISGIGGDEAQKKIKKFTKNLIDLDYDGIQPYTLNEDDELVPSGDEKYISFSINRITGRMLYVMAERGKGVPVPMQTFTCDLTNPKF